jgi:pectinesterase
MLKRIGTIAFAASLLMGTIWADGRAAPVSIAVAFEAGNGMGDGWFEGFRSCWGPQVVVREFRGVDAWKSALAGKPALALLQASGSDSLVLERRVEEALAARAIPVLVAGGERAEALRQFAASEKIVAIEVGGAGGSEARKAGIEAARQLARVQTQLQVFLRTPSSKDIEVVVSPDGSGEFKTIQYALDHAPPVAEGQRLIIHIRPGTYRERVIVPRDRPRTTFRGTDAKTTIITAGMGGKDIGGTFLSATVHVTADDFEAENITFANSYGVGTQAVALHLQSDRAVVHNCRLLGWQDTLYATSGRQYYRDCSIEGHVDFIFGNAAAVFENCEIHSLDSGYIAAHSRTQGGAPTGFVFDRCRLTGKSPSIRVFLGRPWRPYARVIYLHCRMDGHIVPAGWDPWGSTLNEKTAVFAEFESEGDGAGAGQRVGWARRISREEAAAFQAGPFLRGADGWDPVAAVKVLAGRGAEPWGQ